MSGPARIITFYSFHGGTGRSMALANVAWILAGNGRRVLVMDWDLESPGVHRYFRPFLRDPELTSTDGLIDYFIESATGGAAAGTSILNFASSLEWSFASGGALDFIGPGRQGPSYSVRVNGFNWQTFYERLHGFDLLQKMKGVLQKEYDYVLIDSRTGVNDYGRICTQLMPDAVVACFTLNPHSVTECAVALEEGRSTGLTTGWPTVFPVPMRVDYGEKEMLEQARTWARTRFSRLAPEAGDPHWSRVEFPYVPFYSFNEMLAVFGDAPFAAVSILNAAENLTSILSDNRVSRAAPLPPDQREQVRRFYLSRP